ncbi:hypothetical protein [Plantactinospora sp. GCM10030261]|uniref:hypothetical protein n=1 Tax=Plantactinospora sp. GCM10030261 TaxID=3273420 RepID=UPI003605CCAD
MHGKDTIPQDLPDSPARTRSMEAVSPERRIPRQRRFAPLFGSTPVRIAVAASVTCGLGFIAVHETRAALDTPDPLPAAVVDRAVAAEQQHAGRSAERAPLPTPTAPASPTPSAKPKPTATKPAKPARPRPVAGLTQAQMDNAATIVAVGRKLGVPRQGLVVAVATAMQESNLYNLASDVLPESQDYPNQGSGADHDSVGLFQQRPSSGWGTVANLMRPAYAAQKFYQALLTVAGWQSLSLSGAAQAVQASAFPDAYAKHETRARTVVDALV